MELLVLHVLQIVIVAQLLMGLRLHAHRVRLIIISIVIPTNHVLLVV